MKYILGLLLCACFELNADYVKKTIAVCADEQTIEELELFTKDHAIEEGGMELEMWLIKHECKVIDKKTAVSVIGYTGKEHRVLKLLLKQSGEIVYAPSKGIQVEQPGQKNVIYKF